MMLTLNSFLLVDECLLDARRVNMFKKAIERTVKLGDIVVDAGTGTGIMALCAAKAGAKKVFAIELDPDIAKVAQHNIEVNRYDNVIEVINNDVANFKIKGKKSVDVLIMEMLDTGLIAEHQARAMVILRKNGIIDDHTRILPEKADLLVRAIDFDFNFYGFYLPSIIQARNYGVKQHIKNTYSHLHSYGIIEFGLLNSLKLDAKVGIKINKSGVINALELRTNIYLRNNKYLSTTDMNMPIIVPIKSREVKEGEIININISYYMGEGFGKLKII